MNVACCLYCVTNLVINGKILVTGGLGDNDTSVGRTLTIRTQEHSRNTGNMITSRRQHQAVRLDSGQVLIVGEAYDRIYPSIRI